MRKISSVLPLLCGLLLLNLAACGGGGGGNNSQNNTVPDYTVTITPASASVRAGETQQFTATVAAPVNNGVTWGLYGEGNCLGTACGTITSSGLYTAPLVVPNPATVHVTATSKDSASSSAGVVVTILAGVTVSVSPLTANVSVNGTQQFTALVQNTTNTAVNWSVSGSGCTGASCGTISDAGLYTAPSAVPSPATVTVTATLQANTSKSASATVTIGGSSLEKLNGHFAFLFSGFDTNGAMHTAGSFVADGNGHLTSGLQDINRTSGVNAQVAFTGTYTLGADGRGELTLTSTLGTSKYRYALNADSTEARVIEFDSTGTHCSGVFINQNLTAFSTSTIVGDYVLGFNGSSGNSARVAAVGKFHADGAGHFSNGTLDLNDGSATPPAMSNWTGTYAVNANGRGTATLTVAGIGTLNFSFYVGFTDHSYIQEPAAMFFVSLDSPGSSTPVLSGQVIQKFPASYNAASWPSGGFTMIFTVTGSVPGGGTDAMLGAFAGDGVSQVAKGRFDRNRAGTISASSSLGGTYAIDASGRGTVTFQLSAQETLPIIFYLATPGRAVFLGSPSSTVPVGFLWTMGGGGAPGDPTVFSGDYAAGPFALPSADTTVFTGAMHSDGAGYFSGTQDISGPEGNSAGELIAGTYSYTDRGLGTGTLSDGGKIALYMIELERHLAISIDPDNTNPMVLVMRK
jgi:hypothetical protein